MKKIQIDSFRIWTWTARLVWMDGEWLHKFLLSVRNAILFEFKIVSFLAHHMLQIFNRFQSLCKVNFHSFIYGKIGRLASGMSGKSVRYQWTEAFSWKFYDLLQWFPSFNIWYVYSFGNSGWKRNQFWENLLGLCSAIVACGILCFGAKMLCLNFTCGHGTKTKVLCAFVSLSRSLCTLFFFFFSNRWFRVFAVLIHNSSDKF